MENIDLNTTLKEIPLTDCSWDWNFLSFFMDNSILSYIAVIQPPNHLVGNDELICRWSDHGQLTIKSAYHFLTHESLNPEDN